MRLSYSMIDPLRIHVRPRLRNPLLILSFEGWNDAGDAATLAARYIADSLRAAPLAEIDPEEFYDFTVRRPEVQIADDGVREIRWPQNGFRFGALDGGRDLIVGHCIEPHLRWRSFCELLVDLASRSGVREVVLLGAYLAEVLYSRPVGITGFASRKGRLDGLGVRPSGYEGPTGIVGVLAERLVEAGFEVVSLWAALPHYISAQPNPRGALALLHTLRQGFGLKLDDAPLQRAAAEFEQRISAMVAADPELSEYVRELKRREFAQ